MLTKAHRQEGLARAYVQALAAAAGRSVGRGEFDYGIDCLLHAILQRGRRRPDLGPVLALQIKCTTRVMPGNSAIGYDLDVKNYDDLRETNRRVPLLLALVILPADEADWLVHGDEELAIHGAAYWFSLRGAVATEARRTVRIAVPRANRLTVPTLRALADRSLNGEWP